MLARRLPVKSPCRVMPGVSPEDVFARWGRRAQRPPYTPTRSTEFLELGEQFAHLSVERFRHLHDV
jgi:hypothetical protein